MWLSCFRNLNLLLIAVCMVLSLSLVGACSSSEDADGDGDSDGDTEGMEAEEEPACDDEVMGCSGTVVILCRDGKWEHLDDCAEVGMRCERGLCAPIIADGDEDSDQDLLEQDFEPPPDTTPPEVASTSPADEAVGVDSHFSRIRINFTEAVDPVDFTLKRDITISGGCARVTFSGRLTNDHMQIELTLMSTLEEGERYTVNIVGGTLQDAAENLFAGYSFSFTVAGEVDGDCDGDLEDLDLPGLDHSFPYEGEYGVSTSLGFVQIYFTERLRVGEWIAADKVDFAGDDGHRPSFSSSWQDDNARLSIILNDTLHSDMVYRIEMDEGLTDYEDNPLGKVSIWFSTAAAPLDGDSDLTDGDDVEEEIDGDGGDGPPPNTGQLVDEDRTACLDNREEAAAAYSRAVDYLSYDWNPDSVHPENSRLLLTHHNVSYDRCLQDISFDFEQNGWELTFRETVSAPVPCNEDCQYDVTAEVSGLFPGTYDVYLFSDGAASPLYIQVNLPLPGK